MLHWSESPPWKVVNVLFHPKLGRKKIFFAALPLPLLALISEYLSAENLNNWHDMFSRKGNRDAALSCFNLLKSPHCRGGRANNMAELPPKAFPRFVPLSYCWPCRQWVTDCLKYSKISITRKFKVPMKSLRRKEQKIDVKSALKINVLL